MQRTLLLILALSFVAASQTMTGLPGIQLAKNGNTPQVQVVNTTGKTLVELTTRDEGNEFGTFWLIDNPIPSDGTPHLVGQYVHHANHNPNTVSIDTVIFADGSFAGPDTHGDFAGMSRAVDEFVAVGKLAQAGAWSAVQSLSQGPGWSNVSREAETQAMGQKMAAMLLLRARQRLGDTGAADLAARYVALGKLHKQ